MLFREVYRLRVSRLVRGRWPHRRWKVSGGTRHGYDTRNIVC